MGFQPVIPHRLLLWIGWVTGLVGFLFGVGLGYAQTTPRIPHAVDPNYEKSYQKYRTEMAARTILSPALGYYGSPPNNDTSPPQPNINSPGQGGLAGAFSSLGQSIQKKWHQFSELFTPKEKVEKAPEPTSVFNPARPSADTYVAMARFCAENGRLAEAEQHYLNALRANPRHLVALLGYAKLQEQQGRPTEAMQIYQRALSLYPQEPAVLNNAGLCYARNGQLETAANLLHRAVQLEPKKPLYRNNLAMVLVDLDRPEAALGHLRSVYPEAVARYNLGQLLVHKGDWEAAAQQFAAALQADPSMQSAQAWLDELARRKAAGAPGPAAQMAQRPHRPSRGQNPGAWSEITDLPTGLQAGHPHRPQPGQHRLPHQNSPLQPTTSPESPSVRLEHPRIYTWPGGSFSAEPPTPTNPSTEEEPAPLPPVEAPQR